MPTIHHPKKELIDQYNNILLNEIETLELNLQKQMDDYFNLPFEIQFNPNGKPYKARRTEITDKHLLEIQKTKQEIKMWQKTLQTLDEKIQSYSVYDYKKMKVA